MPSGAEGAFPASPVSWAAAGGSGTVAASRSPVTHSQGAGEGGLPGSRDEEAQPGRPGSSLVTRASVACKQSLRDNGKRGKGRCLTPASRLGSKPCAASRTKAVGKQKVGGTLGWPEPSLAPAAMLEEGFQFLQGAFPIPESG